MSTSFDKFEMEMKNFETQVTAQSNKQNKDVIDQMYKTMSMSATMIGDYSKALDEIKKFQSSFHLIVE